MEKKIFLRFNKEKKLEPKIEEVVKKSKEDDGNFFSSLSLALEFGFVVSFPIAGGTLLGQYLDTKFASGPRLTLSLLFLGIMIAGINIYKIVKDSQ